MRWKVNWWGIRDFTMKSLMKLGNWIRKLMRWVRKKQYNQYLIKIRKIMDCLLLQKTNPSSLSVCSPSNQLEITKSNIYHLKITHKFPNLITPFYILSSTAKYTSLSSKSKSSSTKYTKTTQAINTGRNIKLWRARFYSFILRWWWSISMTLLMKNLIFWLLLR